MVFFKPMEKLGAKKVDLERARDSLRDELEIIEHYQTKIDATQDTPLKQILTHNMDEEKEHVTFLLEWMKKNTLVQRKIFEKYNNKLGV